MERVFLFAAMWSFGGALSSDSKSDDRRAFSQEWRRLLPPKTVKIPEQVRALCTPQSQCEGQLIVVVVGKIENNLRVN